MSVIEDVKTVRRGSKMEPLRVEFIHATLNGLEEKKAGLDGQDEVKLNKPEEVNAGLYIDENNQDGCIAVCEAGGICYMGSTLAETNHSQQVFIALKNKKTNKIKLVELSKVFLTPDVKYPDSTNPTLTDGNNDKTAKSKADLKREFAHRFGMLKGQRMHDQAERLTVEAEVMSSNLESAAASAVIEKEESQTGDSSFEHILPPRNVNAALMSTVYNLESIISEEDMEYLDSLANNLILKADELSQLDDRVSLSQYFKEEITKLIQSSKLNEKRKLVLVKALLYTECLIQLASAGKSIPPGLNHLCPGGLDKRVIKIFSLVERGPTKFNKEKILCHVIVLALIIGDYSFNFEHLRASLKVETETLNPLITVVGAKKIKQNSGAGLVRLSLPLAKFYKKSAVGKKRGRN